MKQPPRRRKDRAQLLSERRNRKMARSAHAYVRGSTEKFYEWLGHVTPNSLPEGPAVWICGDCHLGNIGPVADSEGQIEPLVRDFDQSVVGNPAHDIVRLGLSLAMAARGSDLSGVTTARMLENMIGAYVQVCEGQEPATAKSRALKEVLANARGRGWKHLAQERAQGDVLRLPAGPRFWPLLADERAAIDQLAADPRLHALVTRIRRRHDDAAVELLDAGYWVKGCSSLGRLRFALLFDVGGNAKRGRDFCLVDVKEAARALAPRSAGAEIPRDNAERVVVGASAMSPFLGDRMLPGRVLDRPVVVRELLPEDLKLEVDRVSPGELVKVARSLAAVIAKAHTCQMDADARRGWGRELCRNHSRSLEMPSWLWTSVVDLIAIHERAYLDHCRRFTASKQRHQRA